jgi:hypothetical protein
MTKNWKEVDPKIEAEFNLKDDLSIDKYNLEDEWCNQPYLVFKWGVAVAEAEADLERAKNNLEVAKANLDSEIRKHPGNYGINGKVTETVIERVIITDKGIKNLQSEVVEAKRRYTIIMYASRGIDHKKYSLEYNTKLYLNSYYVEPYASKEMKGVSQEQTKETVKEQLNQSMRRRNNQ